MPRPVQDASQLLERALALLARRAHGRAELARKLQRYQPSPTMVDEVLARLESMGFVDDARFAEGVAGSLARSGRAGPARIAGKLRQHGIAAAGVKDAVGGLDTDWGASCRALARTRVARGEDLRDPKARARLVRFLAGRGFPPPLVYEVLRELGAEAREGEGIE